MEQDVNNPQRPWSLDHGNYTFAGGGGMGSVRSVERGVKTMNGHSLECTYPSKDPLRSGMWMIRLLAFSSLAEAM